MASKEHEESVELLVSIVLLIKVELNIPDSLSNVSAKIEPRSLVVDEMVAASVGGIIIPSSSVTGSSTDLLPERFSSLPVSGISDSFVGGAISLGIGIIFILRLVADATTTSVITAKLPITIAEVLIATI